MTSRGGDARATLARGAGPNYGPSDGGLAGPGRPPPGEGRSAGRRVGSRPPIGPLPPAMRQSLPRFPPLAVPAPHGYRGRPARRLASLARSARYAPSLIDSLSNGNPPTWIPSVTLRRRLPYRVRTPSRCRYSFRNLSKHLDRNLKSGRNRQITRVYFFSRLRGAGPAWHHTSVPLPSPFLKFDFNCTIMVPLGRIRRLATDG